MKTSRTQSDPLQALASIRARLAAQKSAAPREAANDAATPTNHRQGAAAGEAGEGRALFAAEVGAVQPLRRAGAAPLPRPRPAPTPRQRQRDDQAVLAEAISDGFDAESLLDTDDTLSFRRRGIGIDVVRKLRRGVWALQEEIDLHGLRRDEARQRVGDFLRDAARRGLRCVRIVHGKGLGSPGREPVLKAKVRVWLTQHDAVLAFVAARPADGGHGAVVVLLRPSAQVGSGRREISPPDASRSR